jgi:hypothetical protein
LFVVILIAGSGKHELPRHVCSDPNFWINFKCERNSKGNQKEFEERRYATGRKVAVSRPDEVNEFFKFT